MVEEINGEEDYLAFMSSDGRKTINFVQVRNQFFVNYGTTVVISPMNCLRKVEYSSESKIARVYFQGKEGEGGTLELDLSYDELIEEFVKRFVSRSRKNRQEKKNKWKLFGTKLFGGIGKRPTISKIDLEGVSRTNKISIEIPRNTYLRKKEDKYYITYKGRRIPVREYIGIQEGEGPIEFFHVVKKTAESLLEI